MCLIENIVKMSGCRGHSQKTIDNALELSTGIELEWITIWRADAAASQADGFLLSRKAKCMLGRGGASIQSYTECFL